MDSIDAFANIPIVMAGLAGFLLLTLLVISKLRNTSKVSFVFFISLIIFIAGTVYIYFKKYLFFFVLIVFIVEILISAYLFVVAFAPQLKKDKSVKIQAKSIPDIDDKVQDISQDIQQYKNCLKDQKMLIENASLFFKKETPLISFFEYFSQLIKQRIKSDGCAVLLFDEIENLLTVVSFTGVFPPPYELPQNLPHSEVRVSTSFKFAEFSTERNIFGDIFTGGSPVNIKEPEKDSRIFQNGPEDFLKCGPYIFIPIQQNGIETGLICLSRIAGAEPFSDEEFDDACRFSEAAATALYPLNAFIEHSEYKELTKEGDIASKFQKILLPAKIPSINTLSIGKYFAASENVCGDYYDIIPSRKDRITFVIADVAGKGMKSLVIMIMIRAMLRLISNTNKSSATLLEWINKALCSEKNSTDHFASIALINYDCTEKKMQAAVCGINPIFLYSAKENKIKKISAETEPVGVEKTAQYKDIEISLSKGDIIAACTDGLIECRNEEGVQYSITRLSALIKDNRNLSGKEIANKVKESIKRFCGDIQQYDDQCLLVFKIQE